MISGSWSGKWGARLTSCGGRRFHGVGGQGRMRCGVPASRAGVRMQLVVAAGVGGPEGVGRHDCFRGCRCGGMRRALRGCAGVIMCRCRELSDRGGTRKLIRFRAIRELPGNLIG